MFDHVCLEVSDFAKSKVFYEKLMELLGYRKWAEGEDHIGFGTAERPHFWVNQATSSASTQNVHIAFPVATRKLVEEFYRVALVAGGKPEGEPGLRPEYHPNYFGAFVLDPDGNNIEAVCRKAE